VAKHARTGHQMSQWIRSNRRAQSTRVSTYLSLGWDSNQALVVVGESDNGWGSSLTLCVFNNLSVVSLHNGDAGVGSSQINSDDPLVLLAWCFYTYWLKPLCAVWRFLWTGLFKSVLNIDVFCL
jgi:hypothetical protein